MGKFTPSMIHEWWSKWHWERCGAAPMTDIDRIWVEIRKGQIVCVWDLKAIFDETQYTEKVLTTFFENQHIPYYNVFIRPHAYRGVVFYVERPATKQWATFTEKQMIDWIDNGINEETFTSTAKPATKPITYLYEVLGAST